MSGTTRRLSEIREAIGGAVLRDEAFEHMGFAIHPWPRMLTWLESAKFAGQLQSENIAAVVTTPELVDLVPDRLGVLTHEAPREAFYRLHEHLWKETGFYGVVQDSVIHPSAEVQPGSVIADKGVRIDSDVCIEPGAVILSGSLIGRGSIIRAGAVIGAEGFQFMRRGEDMLKVKHTGGVCIGVDVEVQSNVVVNRAIFGGYTEIGDKTKIDGLVHVAHNVRVGKRCSLAAHAMISGSVTIGDDVWIGPGAVLTHAIRVGKGARVTLGSVVVQDVPENGHVSGQWAMPHHRFLAAYKRFMEHP